MKKKFIAFLLTGIITFTGIGVNVSAAEVAVSEQTEEDIDTIYEDFSSETDSELPQNADDADISIDEESGDDIFSTDEIAIEDSDENNISVKDGTQAGSTDDTPVSSTGDSISSDANTAESDFDEPSTEDTGIVIVNAYGDPLKDADSKIIYYKTLQDAIDAIPEYSESNPNATTIQLCKSIVLDKTTRIINKRINIQAVGNISITRSSDDNFKNCMINVVGKDGQLQFFADGSLDSSLTISGLTTSDKVEIIDVFDATFALNPGVTLKDNDYTHYFDNRFFKYTCACPANDSNRFAITNRGDLYRCPEQLTNPTLKIGNIKEGVLNKELDDYFVENNPLPNENLDCKNCQIYGHCFGKCCAERLNGKGVNCEAMKQLTIDRIKRLVFHKY